MPAAAEDHSVGVSVQLGADLHFYDSDSAATLGFLTLGPNFDLRLYFDDYFLGGRAAVTTVKSLRAIEARPQAYPTDSEVNPIDYSCYLGYRFHHAFGSTGFGGMIDVEPFLGFSQSTFIIPARTADRQPVSYRFETASGWAAGADVLIPLLISENSRIDFAPTVWYVNTALNLLDPHLGSQSVMFALNVKMDYRYVWQ